MKLCFIGYGNMAQSIVQCLINNDNHYQISVSSPSLAQGDASGIKTYSDNLAAMDEASIVILAVKPMKMATVLVQIKEKLPENCLLISIAAGLSLAWLEQHCRSKQAIIRSIPNTPIEVGMGATPLVANRNTTSKQKEQAQQLFQSAGLVTWVEQETDMDAFTALSGSGPAYVFLFLDAMINAAKKLGLNEDVAKAFALQTMAGSVKLATGSNLSLIELRKKVTSPAGTTASAIDILQGQGFEEILFQAMEAAWIRAKQLAAL